MPLDPNSILDSTKKVLQVQWDYDVFDVDIIMHINSVFMTLNQLGIGPEAGYQIDGSDETWDAFLGDDLRLNAVKSYMYVRVRMLFDPPQTSYLLEALKQQKEELEWRLSVHREGEAWSTQASVIELP